MCIIGIRKNGWFCVIVFNIAMRRQLELGRVMVRRRCDQGIIRHGCADGFVGIVVCLAAMLTDNVFLVWNEIALFVRVVGIDFVRIGAGQMAAPNIVVRVQVIVIRIVLVGMIVILHVVLLADVFVRRRFVVGLAELRCIYRRVLMVRILNDGALHALAMIAPARTAIP
jgi:hypothetical protein